MTFNDKKINYSDLQGIINGKDKDYLCVNLTEFQAKNSKIVFKNAIIATTTLNPQKFQEIIDFINYYSDYMDFLNTNKLNGCYHVKIIPLTEKDMLKLDTIKLDLGIK